MAIAAMIQLCDKESGPSNALLQASAAAVVAANIRSLPARPLYLKADLIKPVLPIGTWMLADTLT